VTPAPAVPTCEALATEMAPHGLILCGGFPFAEGEDAPAGASGEPARALVLVGHAGSSFWPHFAQWRGGQDAGLPHPLDAWSKTVIGAAARRLGLAAAYPSDKPWLPFQAWVRRAQGLRQSPLGLLIHPRYGLWQAFRAAVLFDHVPQDLPAPLVEPHACDDCPARPCLSACPVGAFDGHDYDVAACRAHVARPEGADCLSGGCLARRACPVGRDYTYVPDQQAFHMAAFSRAGR
jgi:hypothetical protein